MAVAAGVTSEISMEQAARARAMTSSLNVFILFLFFHIALFVRESERCVH
jgi:hypothetical protein